MKKLFFPIVIVLLFITQQGFSQKLKKADKIIVQNLEKHIGYLADDKLEGRRAGTEGEAKAMKYISQQFSAYSLQPKGTEGYIQPFEINDGKEIKNTTHLFINEDELKAGDDFFPFPFSANKSIEAFPAIALNEEDMPWFFNLAQTLKDNKNNPHFDVLDIIQTKAKDVAKKGATALIVYNLSAADDGIVFEPKDRSEILSIPVIYIKKEAAKKYLADETVSFEIKLKVEIGDKLRTGHNVIGYLDNGAANTIVLGAHFDHLGYGEDGNSMLRTGEKLIHNGADDNASGTAALIELAALLKNSKVKTNNYLFIAFSAEELGLNGSKYFTEHPTIDLGKVNYMINMDMVGRMNDETKVVTVGGFGTSPTWSSIIVNSKKMPFTIKVDSSGTGPSDHTSFYRKDIPVLFFFTGLHSDYHRPTDDADKINYTGELRIIQYIKGIAEKTASINQKLAFTKTRETQTTTSARFKVTLGVMPDYTYLGSGLRLDGISDGKAAQKAGLKTGDVIIQLGEHNINSVESYMQALGKFNKGDTAKVKYKRGEEVKETDVVF